MEKLQSIGTRRLRNNLSYVTDMGSILQKVGILIVFCTCFSFGAAAQTSIAASDAPDYIGKTVDMTEMVSKVHYNMGSKTCIIIFPDPRVREKSPEINLVIHNISSAAWLRLKALPGNWLRIHGKLLYVKNKYIIDGDDQHTKWQIYTGTVDLAPTPPAPDSLHKTGN